MQAILSAHGEAEPVSLKRDLTIIINGHTKGNRLLQEASTERVCQIQIPHILKPTLNQFQEKQSPRNFTPSASRLPLHHEGLTILSL